MISDRTIGYGALGALALLIAVGFGLILQSYTRQHETRYIRFSNIGTLKIADPVMLSGVAVGKAQEIEWTTEGAIVTMRISPPRPIYEGYSFSIVDLGIMGDRFIAAEFGAPGNRPQPATDTLTGQFVPGPSEALALVNKLEETIRMFSRISHRLAYGDSTTRPIIEQYARALWVTDSLMRQFVILTATVQNLVDTRIDTVLALVGDATTLTRNISTQGPSLLDSLGRQLTALDTTVASAQGFLDKLDTLVARVEPFQADSLHRKLLSLQENMKSIQTGLSTLRNRGLLLKIWPF